MCIDIHNDLYIFDGSNKEYGEEEKEKMLLIKHPLLSNVIDISKGGEHTFVKTSNGIYGFGKNNWQQLGIESEDTMKDTYNILKPIQVLKGTEDIWCSNTNKSLGKSARSILPRPNQDSDSPPLKKQKIE